MIGAILAVFTAAALMGHEEPTLVQPFPTLAKCQEAATDKALVAEARKNGVALVCLQLKVNV